MGNKNEHLKIVFRGVTYEGISDIPAIVPVKKTRGIRHSPPSKTQEVPDIIATQLKDGRVVLAYKGVTHIPTNEGLFIAQTAAKVAREKSDGNRYVAFDIGTGSGVIALHLSDALKDTSDAVVVASDISGAALEVATVNFRINNVRGDIVSLRMRSMLEGLSSEFGRPDLIVSNPPFYTEGRYCGNGFEPDLAFNGGGDGLSFYHKLFAQSADLLHGQSLIVIQIQEINLNRVLGSLERFLPGANAGMLVGPQERICGLVIGSGDNVTKYSDQIVF